MNIRTSFGFILPNGSGVKTETGRKVNGTMRLVQVKDLLAIERDASVKQETAMFYVVLLSKVITKLGTETTVNRKTIERLSPTDFAFLVDFLHQINHQVIKRLPLKCESCGHSYWGVLSQLGEA